MARSRRRLVAVLSAVGVTAVGLVAQASASPASSTGTTYSIEVGPAKSQPFTSDTPAYPIIDKEGTFYAQQAEALYGANDPRHWRFYSGTNYDDALPNATLNTWANPANPVDKNNDTTWRCNNSPTGVQSTLAPPASPYSQPNYCDLMGMWVDPDTGNWIGLVHNEFTPQPFGDGMHYDSIDYAKSTDQGRTWTIVDHVLTSPYSTKRGDRTAFPNQTYKYGDGDQRLFVDTASGYFYVYYGSSVVDKPGGGGAIHRLEHVARAPLSGKMARGTWMKWYDGTWSEPGVGGRESNIVPADTGNPNGYTDPAKDYKPTNSGYVSQQLAAGTLPAQSPLLYMSVTYNAYLGLYIAGANPLNPNDSKHAEPFYATDDLSTQKWHKIGDTGSALYGDYWYHWYADSVNASSGNIVGRTFRNYCEYNCSSNAAEYRNITIESSDPAASPADPSKTYRISSRGGLALTQLSGSSSTTSVAGQKASNLAAWAFVPNGDGSYRIINAATGQALGIDSSIRTSRAWGTTPIVSPYRAAVGQQWFFIKTKTSGGSYRLVNRYSGLALAMSADSRRRVETTPPRYWSNKTGSSVGGNRNETEQLLTLTAVGINPPQTDLAQFKPATARSEQGVNTADLAVDGDPDTYWSADPYPQWWQVDLLGVHSINNVAVTNYADGTRYYKYNIQASTDGTNWTTIATKETTTPATRAGDSYPVEVQARYLRVNVTYNSDNTGVHITNFTASGS
ncbi:ricin-type beta-trefoil lectin protein [Kribbella rubisoli]|uniref:Ricin-type beta-trefoil lectin protein n=1 Tax=Kribbella rubisoli TaxID=3075929 RepID=A0A4Q7WZ33_9ACTN|nr:ricin-type beta-trefoil lectin protein [Kribbella rubisoli]